MSFLAARAGHRKGELMEAGSADQEIEMPAGSSAGLDAGSGRYGAGHGAGYGAGHGAGYGAGYGDQGGLGASGGYQDSYGEPNMGSYGSGFNKNSFAGGAFSGATGAAGAAGAAGAGGAGAKKKMKLPAPGCHRGKCPNPLPPGYTCEPCGNVSKNLGPGPYSRAGQQQQVMRAVQQRYSQIAAAGPAAFGFGAGSGAGGLGGAIGASGAIGAMGPGSGSGFGPGFGPGAPPDACDGGLLRSLEVCNGW